MNIKIINGFKCIQDSDILLIESDRLEEYMRYATDNRVTKISIQEFHGYKLSSLDFLKKYNFFTEVSVVKDINDIDISGIHDLRNLKCLSLSNDKQGVDFSHFPKLEEVSIDWNNKLSNLNTCSKLRKLTLWKYKPRSKSFLELRGLDGLELLEITQSNIESYIGIEGLHRLSHFEGHYLSKLESLLGIESLARNLKTLILKNCKKLTNYESALGELKSLEKLILADCGDLNGLGFVNKIPSLKFISFMNTNVKDGDLLPLKGKQFEYIGFNDRKHYSHKMKELSPSFSWFVPNV